MIDTIGMTDIGNGRPSNQDAYLLRQKEKNGKLYLYLFLSYRGEDGRQG